MKYIILLLLLMPVQAYADDDDGPSNQNAANASYAASHDGAPPGGTPTSPY